MARRRRKGRTRRYKVGRKMMTARQLRCSYGKRRARSIMRRKKHRKSRRRRR